jgi:hypothetical protein
MRAVANASDIRYWSAGRECHPCKHILDLATASKSAAAPDAGVESVSEASCGPAHPNLVRNHGGHAEPLADPTSSRYSRRGTKCTFEPVCASTTRSVDIEASGTSEATGWIGVAVLRAARDEPHGTVAASRSACVLVFSRAPGLVRRDHQKAVNESGRLLERRHDVGDFRPEARDLVEALHHVRDVLGQQ